MLNFELIQKDPTTSARRGRYHTAHGAFDTPNFMPVGTRASVKGVDCERLKEAGTQITLVNTLHLTLRPGEALINSLGGIHRFMNWSGPVLSDSGGYQVFSLAKMRKMTEEGVTFNSPLDGARCFLSPERSIQIQQALGVDIAMAFDECPSSELDHAGVERSLALTTRWAKRSIEARTRSDMAVFGITQGGIYKDLRTRAAEEICALPFQGFAIGGVSVGEKKEHVYEVLSYHPGQLPADKIRYIMGVGTPRDLVEGVRCGIDLFDCVMPSRSGRFGRIFVGSDDAPFINIKNNRFHNDTTPVDKNCSCVLCRNYSRAYLHHLFRLDEMLGPVLASIHNLTHYLTLMRQMRETIEAGTFDQFYNTISALWQDKGLSTGDAV